MQLVSPGPLVLLGVGGAVSIPARLPESALKEQGGCFRPPLPVRGRWLGPGHLREDIAVPYSVVVSGAVAAWATTLLMPSLKRLLLVSGIELV